MDTVTAHVIPTRQSAYWRRSLFFGLTLLSTCLGGALMYSILDANGLAPLELVGLVLFIVLFTWIAGSFWTAAAGFVVRLIGRDPVAIHPDELTGQPLAGRTALAMPIYNEDVERVAAGVDAIWTSLVARPEAGAFDFFILSDTRKPEVIAKEQAAWRSLVVRHDAAGRIHYRNRAENSGRKAGNVADFVCKWGSAYDYMVVLDADSIMSGKTLVALAQLMDAHPETGIIQALPMPVGRETLFARLVQFAARLNGPMLASGLSFWQLGESNYWGHNAIIRVQAFAAHCALPHLPGKPFGGDILSHDFVEAAFMRRAGYKVWLVADLGGSWEELPSNIIDYAARDRRWTQGNLQHMRVLPMRGLHWLSRMHMLTGILSYATSPIWFVVLLVSTILTCMDALHVHVYFQPGARALFPDWPVVRIGEIDTLLTVTIIVLLLPKLMGATLAIVDRTLRRGFGGVGRLAASLVVEQLFSMMLAPAMMMFHSSFVVATLLGRKVSWSGQDRSDRGTGYAEAIQRHGWHVMLGLLWGAAVLLCAPRYIGWLLPVIVGLLLSVWLSMFTSRLSLGRKARAWGLFLTPEETSPPPELAATAGHYVIGEVPKFEPALSLPVVPPLHMEALPIAYVAPVAAVGSLCRGARSLVRFPRRAPAIAPAARDGVVP